jgi:hypothetical protein
MKCFKCGKEAVGITKIIHINKKGKDISKSYKGLCKEHLLEEL